MKDGKLLTIKLSVDELCANGKPNTTFWFHCIKNKYLEWDDSIQQYRSQVDYIHLEPSENKDKNDYVVAMFDYMGIHTFF